MEIRTSAMSSIDRATVHHTQFPWEDYGVEAVQGGSEGFVFDRASGGSYRTAFVEVGGGEVSFIRGEGATVSEAEADAWAQFQAVRKCVNHEYEPRGYTNGAGFCRHCDRFEAKVFTAEQLEQFCHVCQTSTFQKCYLGFVCAEHHPGKRFADRREELKALGEENWTLEQENEYFEMFSKEVKAGQGLDPDGDWQ